ncbi:hypothetical protein ACFWBF_28550 [Streptomyces sp. NPDC060028]
MIVLTRVDVAFYDPGAVLQGQARGDGINVELTEPGDPRIG